MPTMLTDKTADFESSAIGSVPGGAYSGGSKQSVANRMMIVATPKRRGTRSCRIDCRAGDDPINSSGDRCEWTDFRDPDPNPGTCGYFATCLYFPDGTDPFGRGDPRWVSGSQWNIVLQNHHQNGSFSPPMSVCADRNWNSWSAEKLWLDIRGGPQMASPTKAAPQILLDPLPRGVWIDVILYVEFVPTGGKIEAWTRVGTETSFTKRVSLTNVKCHYSNDAPGSYMKGGIYRGDSTINNVIYTHGYVVRDSLEKCISWCTDGGGGGTTDPPPTTSTLAEDSNRVGVDDSGTAMANATAGNSRGSVFTPSISRSVPRMKVWMDGGAGGTGSQPLKAIIYRASDGARVAVSSEVSVIAGMAAKWQAFPFDPVPNIDGGVAYRLALTSGGTTAVARYGVRQASGDQLEWDFDTFADPQDPWTPNASGNPDSKLLSIYAVTDVPVVVPVGSTVPVIGTSVGNSVSTGVVDYGSVVVVASNDVRWDLPPEAFSESVIEAMSRVKQAGGRSWFDPVPRRASTGERLTRRSDGTFVPYQG